MESFETQKPDDSERIEQGRTRAELDAAERKIEEAGDRKLGEGYWEIEDTNKAA